MNDAIQTGDSTTAPASRVRVAGLLLVLYAVATLISVAGARRCGCGPAHADAVGLSLLRRASWLTASVGLPGLPLASRCAAAAVMLLRTVTTENRSLLGLALGLFVISGVFTVASGVCSVLARGLRTWCGGTWVHSERLAGSGRCAAVGVWKGWLHGGGTGLDRSVASSMAGGRRPAVSVSGHRCPGTRDALHMGGFGDSASQHFRGRLS